MPPWACSMEDRLVGLIEDKFSELKAAIVGARLQMADEYLQAEARIQRVESLHPERATGEHQTVGNGNGNGSES